MGALTTRYQVGGSISASTSIYVERQADKELIKALQAQEFCYVFNSRQMGKSSLLLKTKQDLQAQGVDCCFIDVSRIGSSDTTIEQWFGGIVYELCRGFDLLKDFDPLPWWRSLGGLPPAQKLSDFLEKILLPSRDSQMVIFLDEIDSVLSLNFSSDDFFSVIRFCFNQRAANPEFRRLQFALFGVALPTDLMSDKTRSPFNIGHAVGLQGFGEQQALALAAGLPFSEALNQALIRRALHWSGGQPFLTQKVCQLISNHSETPPKTEQACSDWLDTLLATEVLADWEGQDNPEHLRTIRDRVLLDETNSLQNLGLYQKVLEQQDTGVSVERVSGHERLYLTGLVEIHKGRIFPRNRLYTQVFDAQWVESHLAARRPYHKALRNWLDRGRSADALLSGEVLAQSVEWARGKSLADEDYQFLGASQDAEKRQVEALNLRLTEEISERKAAQQQLKTALAAVQEAQVEAERANKAKSEFMARVSHEVRTPLNAILGLSYLAQQNSSPATQSYLDKIHNSASYMLGMINDIVDFNQVEQGRLSLKSKPFSLDTLADKLVDVIGLRVQAKGLELKLNSPNQLLPNLIGDELRIEQVLINLLTNAIKATEHGQITLNIQVTEHSANQLLVQFSIIDTGPGLPTHIREALIHGNANELGMGLGLCQRLVALMHGEWQVRSDPEFGSSVGFTLPLTCAGEAPNIQAIDNLYYLAPLPNALLEKQIQLLGGKPVGSQTGAEDWIVFDGLLTPEQDLSKRGIPLLPAGVAQSRPLSEFNYPLQLHYPLSLSKLHKMLHSIENKSKPLQAVRSGQHWQALVAEDNDINQQVIEELLRRWGIEAHLCSDGQQALSAIQEQAFDLVLMDVDMPKLNGLQATQAIRALPQDSYRTIPIIAMTGHTQADDIHASLEAGMNAHVSKPIDPLLLKNTLEHWLDTSFDAQTQVEQDTSDWLSRLDGIDLSRSLERLANNRQLLGRLLRQFASNYNLSKDDQTQIISSANSSQHSWLHTLKGTSANVGLQAVSEQAQRLESKLQQSQLTESDWTPLWQSLERARTQILSLAPPLNEISDVPLASDAEQHLQRLIHLLDEDLGEAQQVLQQLPQIAQRDQIQSALDEFDVESAQVQASSWLAEIKDS
ncbi:AAA-like domain-containing protein [Paraferrimonas sedimenticola]|uniref:histidine kinase n=1 Tax=Paraferrimonas sedimenticola TaxID=375674 RepID=A0AA37RY64_9GAMM|nr:AAA-like domain-containing protein [Paraferrimonas sedimenticola]GLP97261.1 hypothetical protein GCM10007895_25680 [Paraferrimonas sedimenticola]